MTPEQSAIIDYLSKITKGLFRCTPSIANRVIELATGNNIAYVIKQHHNAQTGNYDNLHVIKTTDDAIKQVQIKMLKPIPGFYRYECYNAAGVNVFNLLTINPSLFN